MRLTVRGVILLMGMMCMDGGHAQSLDIMGKCANSKVSSLELNRSSLVDYLIKRDFVGAVPVQLPEEIVRLDTGPARVNSDRLRLELLKCVDILVRDGPGSKSLNAFERNVRLASTQIKGMSGRLRDQREACIGLVNVNERLACLRRSYEPHLEALLLRDVIAPLYRGISLDDPEAPVDSIQIRNLFEAQYEQIRKRLPVDHDPRTLEAAAR